jgi:hypothetical protein
MQIDVTELRSNDFLQDALFRIKSMEILCWTTYLNFPTIKTSEKKI